MISNVQLPGSNRFYYLVQIHTSNQNNYVSLSKEFQQHLTKEHSQKWCHWSGQMQKSLIERKWTYRQYHVEDNADVAQKYVWIYFNTNQFLALPFCGTHSKPHGARELSKHYHLCFYLKLGNGICAICCIPHVYVACTSMLKQTLDIWYTIR